MAACCYDFRYRQMFRCLTVRMVLLNQKQYMQQQRVLKLTHSCFLLPSACFFLLLRYQFLK